MTTLNEIARLANVSVGTVDRVIHNRGRVSAATSQKVRKLIEEFDYRPNVLARNLSLQRKIRFGILMPSIEQDGKYWELPLSGVMKAAEELKVYQVEPVIFHYDKYSEDSFRDVCDQIRDSLSTLDGLLIAPVLSFASEQFICRLPEKLPYVFIDSYIPDSRCLTYIGQDSFQSGILAARLMQMKAVSGTIAVMHVLPMDYHLEDRVRGFREGFAGKPEYNLVGYDVNRIDDPQIFLHMTQRVVQEHPDIRGLFVPSACTHQAAEGLINVHRDQNVILVGYDLVEENRKHLKNGVIDFIISQRPSLQGYQGIYSLYKKVILSEPVDEKVIVPMDILTKENVDYYQG